ncbi:GGDEF domain-containing protein [Yoonia maritima]|uniref:GGDEF domain-containing protein n=1 Tax=Yoonia maritima TaxID=1435347 RepID=UPI001EF7B712|nr:GGDEF domain-containing protein [Yoonia maritima]
MEKLMRILEPRSAISLFGRFAVALGLITLANYTFAHFHGVVVIDDRFYYLKHAIYVGGPFALFALSIMMFQVRLQRKLSLLSRKDGLTGLNNRRTFLECADRRRENGDTGALLLLDADHFKRINDAYGHQAGDICLQSISETLQRNVRRDDVVGRIGGEEFAIFLCNASIQQARIIGERLTRPIPFHPTDHSTEANLSVTLSVGAVENRPHLSLSALLAQADQALYRAKADGRARIVIWNDQLVVH